MGLMERGLKPQTKAEAKVSKAKRPGKNFQERRRVPRPPLAEIRQGAALDLVPVPVLCGLVRISEFLLAAILGFAIYLLHVDRQPGDHAVYLGVVIAGAAIYVAIAQSARLYDIASFRSLVSSFPKLALIWSCVLAALMAGAFFGKVGAEFSRVWLASWYIATLGALLAERSFVSLMIRRWTRDGQLFRRAVIVGGGPEAEELIKALEASPNPDLRIAGIFDDRSNARVSPIVSGYPKLGTIKELVEFARHSRVDLLIISLPVRAEKRLLQILKLLWVLPVDIRLSAHNNALRFRPRSYSYIGNVPFFDLADKPITNWAFVEKWLFDKIAAGLLAILLAPLMVLIALAIKLDSKGPVFFKQKRQGFNNELIEIYKFRSMYTDKADEDAAKLVTKGDPRVTRIGRILRKTSLDELPQLFNVLKGDLSLVGPRPHALKAKAGDQLYGDAVTGYFARHRVKPGVTGWAQINGWRGETDTMEKIKRRVEYDLYYIDNWTPWLDLYIVLMTPFALLKTQNAY